MIKKIMLLCAFSTLVGCVSLFPDLDNAPEFIHLNPQLVSGPVKSSIQVVVEEPISDLLHNSTKIITVSADQQKYKFASGKEWHERMPVFIQRDLVKAIATKGLMGVGTPNKGLKPDYILSCEVNKFLVSNKDPERPQVIIDADFSLMKMPGRKIVARQNFSGSMVSEKGFPNILISFDVLYSQMLNKISSWAVDR